MPTRESIDNIKALLVQAFRLLLENDSDLISLSEPILERYLDAEILERKLHEVCINHRLAYYIEELLPSYFLGKYKVDIEYNRYYRNKKHLKITTSCLSYLIKT